MQNCSSYQSRNDSIATILREPSEWQVNCFKGPWGATMVRIKLLSLILSLLSIGFSAYARNAHSIKTPSPDPAPAPAPAPAPTGAIPSGFTAIYAANYGVKCDGVTDDTLALQSALNALSAYKALQLPTGTCVVSNILRVQSKTNVAVVGMGTANTIIKTTNPAYTSFVVYAGTAVILQDFQIYGPNTIARGSDANTRGVYVERSTSVKVVRVKVNNVAGAGIVFYICNDSSIENSEVYHSWADAFHITGGSKNILVQNNTTTLAGDDCFASIGYGAAYNYNIQFLNNSCYRNTPVDGGASGGGSGVAFEGTIGGKAYGNYIFRSAVAGIRVASASSYSTGIDSQIDIQNNTLVNVRTRTEVDHAAIMIYSSYDTIDNVNISNNQVIDPLTRKAMWVLSYNPLISYVTLSGNQITDSTNFVTYCSVKTGNLANITITGNTKNGVACN
jgi:hypothetical protein